MIHPSSSGLIQDLRRTQAEIGSLRTEFQKQLKTVDVEMRKELRKGISGAKSRSNANEVVEDLASEPDPICPFLPPEAAAESAALGPPAAPMSPLQPDPEALRQQIREELEGEFQSTLQAQIQQEVQLQMSLFVAEFSKGALSELSGRTEAVEMRCQILEGLMAESGILREVVDSAEVGSEDEQEGDFAAAEGQSGSHILQKVRFDDNVGGTY